MKWLLRISILALLVTIVSTEIVKADELVIVSARGVLVSAPGGFTIVYVDDLHVMGYWTIPPTADIVELRYRFEDYPRDINDGTLVYSGNNTSALIDLDLTIAGVPYFRIWSRRATTGQWEVTGNKAKGDFMTQSWTWMILLMFALATTIVPFIARILWTSIPNKVLSGLTMAAAWFAFIDFVLEAENGFVFDINRNWAKLISIAVIALIFNIILAAMGSTIDKSGSIVAKQRDDRSRSTRAQEDYTRTLRDRLRR